MLDTFLSLFLRYFSFTKYPEKSVRSRRFRSIPRLLMGKPVTNAIGIGVIIEECAPAHSQARARVDFIASAFLRRDSRNSSLFFRFILSISRGSKCRTAENEEPRKLRLFGYFPNKIQREDRSE